MCPEKHTMRPLLILLICLAGWSKYSLAQTDLQSQAESPLIESLRVRLRNIADYFGFSLDEPLNEWPPEPAPDYRADAVRSHMPGINENHEQPCKFCSQRDYTDNIAETSFETSLCGEPIDVVYV